VSAGGGDRRQRRRCRGCRRRGGGRWTNARTTRARTPQRAAAVAAAALWEQNQNKTWIAVAATGQLGSERNRDKTGIGWTMIGSQSPLRAADSSIVPDHDVDPYRY